MSGRLINSGAPRTMSLDVDENGYREYTVVFLVETSSFIDGPFTVLYDTPGMPLPGSPWIMGSELDLWVWARPNAKVGVHSEKEGDSTRKWRVEMRFSNKPLRGDAQRCFDIKIEDPLLEPMKISGDVRERQVEITRDRFGKPLLMSSLEPIRGKQVEFEENVHLIEVEQNVIDLQLPLLAGLKDCVNDRTLWGMPKRTVLFQNYRWERKYHGLCYKYYTRRLTVAINEKGWDRDVMDEGAKGLNGHWGVRSRGEVEGRWYLDFVWGDNGPDYPDERNPTHFIQLVDKKGQPARFPLDGHGSPFFREVTDECAECTETAPDVWTLSIGPDLFELTHTGNCVWGVVLDNGDEYVMDIEGDNWILRRGIELTGQVTSWVIPAAEFQCNGSNAFLRFNPPIDKNTWDIWATISPLGPGRIHVEHYNEANLLLLGIPPILELA